MFGFDKMFDFNRDGKLDSWERAAQFQFMDEMMSWNLWIRMKEEKCWKMRDWIRMSLIFKVD